MYQPPQSGNWQEQPAYPSQSGYLQQQPQTPPPGYQPQFQQPTPHYMQQPSFTPPPMPPTPQKKKSRTWLWIVGMILVAIVSYSVGAGSHSDTTTTVATNNTSTSAAQPTQAPKATTKPANSHHKIGETVNADDIWQVTINSATTSQGTDVSQPKAGNVFLLIPVTMKNISNESHTASSLVQWDLKGTDGTKYNVALGDSPGPDGQVEAGGPLKGTLTYEVPANTKTFTLSFITSLTDTNPDIWDIQVQ